MNSEANQMTISGAKVRPTFPVPYRWTMKRRKRMTQLRGMMAELNFGA